MVMKTVLMVGLSMLAVAPVGASAWIAGAASARGCVAVQRTVRVHVVDHVGLDPDVLEVAQRQAEDIWRGVGLRLVWSAAPTQPMLPDGRSVLVVIRRQLKLAQTPLTMTARGRARRPLGWVVFGPDGRPGSLIEVSFETVAGLVVKGAHLDPAFAALPYVQQRALARGLGRVIAHELGHWLMGRGHVEDGLMKARFTAHDLTYLPLPELPKAWTKIDHAIEDAAAPRCVALALRRLASE